MAFLSTLILDGAAASSAKAVPVPIASETSIAATTDDFIFMFLPHFLLQIGLEPIIGAKIKKSNGFCFSQAILRSRGDDDVGTLRFAHPTLGPCFSHHRRIVECQRVALDSRKNERHNTLNVFHAAVGWRAGEIRNTVIKVSDKRLRVPATIDKRIIK